jgi:molybdate transport system regulatory protein
MKKELPEIRLHLWLETKDGLFFGMGRAMLLAKIDQYGSLKRAADELGMSYRAAWGKIKKSEEILGAKLVVQYGSKKEGYQLTDLGRTMMEKFMLWFEEVEKEAFNKAREMLPWTVGKYGTGRED